MKVYVLSGQINYEDYTVYGVYSSLERAQFEAEPLIKAFGGRWPSPDTRMKRIPTPDEWPSTWEIEFEKNGESLQITEHVLDES